MTQTTGFTGIGAALKLGDAASPETFNVIGNTTSFSIEQQADQVDATHLQSTSGFREYKQGFKAATVSFEGHFDPDNTSQDDSTGVMSAFAAGTSRNFKADFSAADNNGAGKPATDPVCSFSGVITQLSINVAEGMVTYQGQISLSSAPTWGAT
ncbi:phage tail tube protein [Mesorhizobium sp. CA8]|uniref:phage tail tube protein n=1 Tax=Mesorhizobium sp. CA8 TaxID=2876637 RepID=UPI001CCB2C6A|nr:phage tail tube protein [Mesorhizobium sp. CA8]MBZ9759495.1 phage tail tube protein [Mesorhizobium sp. CA8]